MPDFPGFLRFTDAESGVDIYLPLECFAHFVHTGEVHVVTCDGTCFAAAELIETLAERYRVALEGCDE